ncbi:MAG TPA: hypothetical protein PLJ84_09320 [Bacteroidales bacterium]|nr:hypothetical protein [Bacteroidales bacterium]
MVTKEPRMAVPPPISTLKVPMEFVVAVIVSAKISGPDAEFSRMVNLIPTAWFMIGWPELLRATA